ncbi:MAG: response regulator [Luteibaculaceae bacterium]
MEPIKRTYFVEDNDIFTIVFQTIFAACSDKYQELDVFVNGQVALHAIKASEELPDLILLDINMPVMDGWEFLESLKELNEAVNKIPVYILTSSIDPEDEVKAKEYPNVKGYVIKPLSKNRLIEIYEEVATGKYAF